MPATLEKPADNNILSIGEGLFSFANDEESPFKIDTILGITEEKNLAEAQTVDDENSNFEHSLSRPNLKSENDQKI